MNEAIIEKFIDRFKAQHATDAITVTGIIGFGSRFNQPNARPTADLDLYVVIQNIGKRYRGIMRIDDIDVDYFINPIEQLQSDWEKFKNRITSRRTIAYLLRDGKIMTDENDCLKQLQREAEIFLERELEAETMTEAMVTTAKYFIDDYLQDIEDSRRENDLFSCRYTADSLLHYLIEVFCQFHKIPLVKHKYQRAEIVKKDKNFVVLYETVAQAPSLDEQIQGIKKLAVYCLEALGGPLPKEWELESPLTF